MVAIEQARSYADLPIISSGFEMATDVKRLIDRNPNLQVKSLFYVYKISLLYRYYSLLGIGSRIETLPIYNEILNFRSRLSI